jgi:hypothetical protein
MKDQEKSKKESAEERFGLKLTTNNELEKYLAPEFEPEKFKKVKERFKNHPVKNE